MQFKARCVIVSILVSMLLSTGSKAQSPPPFHEAIDRFAKSRKLIRTYHVVVTAGVAQEPTPVLLANGATVNREKVTTSYSLEIVVDKESDARLVFSDREIRDAADGASQESAAALRVTTPSFTIRANRDGGTIKPASDPPSCCEFSLHSMPSFDPLALGFGFAADINRGESWEKIVRHYKGWNARPSKQLESGAIRYGYGGGTRPDFIDMHPSKGFAPERLRHPNGQDDFYAANVKLKSVNGHWVPSFATISRRDRVEVIDLSWKELNEDVSHLLTINGIEGHFGIQLVDRR